MCAAACAPVCVRVCCRGGGGSSSTRRRQTCNESCAAATASEPFFAPEAAAATRRRASRCLQAPTSVASAPRTPTTKSSATARQHTQQPTLQGLPVKWANATSQLIDTAQICINLRRSNGANCHQRRRPPQVSKSERCARGPTTTRPSRSDTASLDVTAQSCRRRQNVIAPIVAVD